MDATENERTRRLTTVFERFVARDAPGFIRAAGHAFVDVLADDLIGAIQDTPATAALPAAELPALPAPEAPAVDVAALAQRVVELEAANRGLMDTIARLSRAQEEKPQPAPPAMPPAPAPSASPRANPPAADLLDIKQVAALVQVSTRTVSNLRQRDKFPAPASMRGKANLWRRADIEAWAARQVDPPAAASEELLDKIQVARRVGCSPLTLNKWISEGAFPPHTHSRGLRHLWRPADIDAWRQARQKEKGQGQKDQRTEQQQPGANAKTCATCADLKTVGRMSVCRSAQGPRRNNTVAPTDTCDFHASPGHYRPIHPEDEE